MNVDFKGRLSGVCAMCMLFTVFRDGSTCAPPTLHDVTNSPLFAVPTIIKRRGFRSSAAPAGQ